MTLTTSFAGISTGLNTDALVAAVMSQESRGLDRLTATQTKNSKKLTVVGSLKTGINSLNVSLAVLHDKMNTGDSASITTAMQDVVTKFNAVQNLYKDNATVTRGSDGSIVLGPLAKDPMIKQMMNDIKLDFSGSKNMTGSSLSNSASIGIKTGADGNLSMDTATFQTDLANDPNGVKSITDYSSLKALTTSYTASTPDSKILIIQKTIEDQNKTLAIQISNTQSKLDVRETLLKAQFSKMETTIAQLKAASSSLFSVTTS